MKHIYIITIFSLNSFLCSSQTFLNGSFENTTSPNSCNYNIPNVTFNSLMNNTFAFGMYTSLDIVISNCYVPSVPDGTYCIAMSNNPNNNIEGEAIAMELSSPLISGNSYTLSFDGIAIPYSGIVQGNLLIGSSTTNNNFGEEIYNATTIEGQWSTFNFTFIAPNNGTYITVMPVPEISSWNGLDNFVIQSTLSTEDLISDKLFKIYPNPTSSVINIDFEFSTAKVFDLTGRKILESNVKIIDFSEQANSIYLIKFYDSSDNELGTSKVIKK